MDNNKIKLELDWDEDYDDTFDNRVEYRDREIIEDNNLEDDIINTISDKSLVDNNDSEIIEKNNEDVSSSNTNVNIDSFEDNIDGLEEENEEDVKEDNEDKSEEEIEDNKNKKSKISNEYKDKIYYENENILHLIYKIFKGTIFRKDLKDICFKFKAVKTNNEFEDRLNDMYEADLIEFGTIKKSRLQCIRIKDYAVKKMEGKKVNIKKIDTPNLLMSHYKFKAILSNKLINTTYKNLNLYSELGSEHNLVTYLMKNTMLSTSGSSTVLHYDILSDWYGITDLTIPTIHYGRVKAYNRDKAILTEELKNIRLQEAQESFRYVEEDRSLDKYEKRGFGDIRSVNGFIFKDSFNSIEKETEGIEIDFFQYSHESLWGKEEIAKYVSESVIYTLNHLEAEVNDIDIKIFCREKNDALFSFSEIVKDVTRRNSVAPEIYIVKRMFKFLEKNFFATFRHTMFKVDNEKMRLNIETEYEHRIEKKFKNENGKHETIAITNYRNVNISLEFLWNNINEDIYEKDIEEALQDSVSEREKEKRELKKSKEKALALVADIESKDKLNNALYLQKYDKKQLKKIDTLLKLSDNEFDKLIDFIKKL